MRILIIEDDKETAAFIAKGLQESGFGADQVHDGKQGLVLALDRKYEVIILDRMLPGLDGLTILKSIRAVGVLTPVLILSALGEVDDRVQGLKAGGDDYLVKPYSFAELLARIQALLRRKQDNKTDTTLSLNGLSLDLLTRKVSRDGQNIDLQPKEFSLLELMLRHKGQVVTRTMILEKVWDYAFDPQTNVVDVHISRLRQKIDKEFDTKLLHTIRGAGYSLREN